MTSEGSNTTAITLRKPTKDDGYRLHQLVAECPPLDPNSIYCNLLQCSHFAETGVAAEKEGDLVGFISGYIPPQQPETVFVWQVAVHEKGRGQGLAKRMLKEIVGRDACSNVTHLEPTNTEDNEYGKFGWVMDPEGNRIELWQPPKSPAAQEKAAHKA